MLKNTFRLKNLGVGKNKCSGSGSAVNCFYCNQEMKKKSSSDFRFIKLIFGLIFIFSDI